MKYLILIICLLISALSFNILQYPNNLVSGGLPGISIIINKYIKISPSTIIFILSVIFFVLSYSFLGRKKTYSSILATFIYPLFVRITSYINFIYISDKIIISILIGIITGISVGLIYKIGFNNGGISILVEIISKYTKISISVVSFIINIIIVLLGWLVVGNNMAIYSSIIIIINSLVVGLIIKNRT